jgi:branched-chain amino acid transport system permease protein
LNSIKDSEEAAECMGVPTLRLKLITTTISGAMMGVAGAPFVSLLTFIDPLSAFDLQFSINAIAMSMIGGTASWVGPVIGALLLGTIQQIVNVTISSELNLLIVGVLLVVFVIIAPSGIIGWFKKAR